MYLIADSAFISSGINVGSAVIEGRGLSSCQKNVQASVASTKFGSAGLLRSFRNEECRCNYQSCLKSHFALCYHVAYEAGHSV